MSDETWVRSPDGILVQYLEDVEPEEGWEKLRPKDVHNELRKLRGGAEPGLPTTGAPS